MIGSPCVNVCQMGPELDLCVGCLRTLEEIARWSMMRDEERLQVIAAVAERRARVGANSAATQSMTSVMESHSAKAHNHPHRR